MNENKEQNSVNENILLEQGELNNKRIMGYAVVGLGLFLLIVILFFSIKSLGSSEEEEVEEKSQNVNNLGDSIKKDKDFSTSNLSNSPNFYNPLQTSSNNSLSEAVKNDENYSLSNDNSQTMLDFLSSNSQNSSDTPQSLPNKNNNNNAFLAQAQSEYPVPRIIKGMGVAVVINRKDIESGSGGGRNLNLVGKPDTVLEFGQNGAMTLEQATEQAKKIAGLTDGNSGGGGGFGGGVGNDIGGGGETFQPTAAHFSNFNASLLLPKGTYIGCVLQTRLVSEVKGGIACVVHSDVYSANGHTLLIEKGSVMTGAYGNGELDDGSTRLFVVWQEIRTPNNVIIPVRSGATDALGASGLEGYVNHHYLKRFGAAILLSVIDDSLSILANELTGKGNSTNYYDYTSSTREQVSEIANTALQATIGIKPTLYKNQGDIVGVYVNKDIDFSKVYQLRRKQ